MIVTDFDIAIIGAGIAGASTAWALLEAAPQLKIVLLEMEERPGYHTTGRSAAVWVESYGGPAIVPLTKASRQFFGAPPTGFDIDVDPWATDVAQARYLARFAELIREV